MLNIIGQEKPNHAESPAKNLSENTNPPKIGKRFLFINVTNIGDKLLQDRKNSCFSFLRKLSKTNVETSILYDSAFGPALIINSV
jgi:hypothetical protein